MLSPALAVLLVLSLLFGLLWLARRKGLAALSMRWSGMGVVARPSRHMRVVERLPLSGQHSLHLVSCAGRLLVVAVSPNGCTALADYVEPSAEARSATGGAC
jgi:flagellar biogenesis protein FliO